MRNKKIKSISLLLVALFLLVASSNLYLLSKSYADDKGTEIFYLAESKPKSGGFSSGGSKNFSKPKITNIKPDSGKFSVKPNKSYKNKDSKSTIKPDSGNFSTKPKNNKSSENKTKKYDDYGNYPRKSRPLFGGFYGFSNPFYGMMYGFRTSSWIMKIVMIITVIVILYIIIDFIRSRRR
ncbi:MAG: hypothetical protein ACRC3Y_14765 [Romboutsia sp.]|uniref:hypothetical protein n=1 Tax=Romboutsia sp. TaxID=1965302 RepID=UPI003F38BD81